MSDKNFKVKNGLDANGAVTITQPDTSTVPLTISANSLATGSDLFQVKRPDGTVRFAVGNDGALSVNSNINFNGGNMTMYPANSGQVALIVNGQTNQSVANLIVKAATGQSGNLQEWRDQNNNLAVSIGPDFAIRGIAGGFFGTANGNIVGVNYLGVKGWAANHIPFVVQGLPSQTGDLTRWVDSSANTLAKVDANGSITAVDLTLSGNLTVNGTTTNLNSTNLVVEDKNIIIADVATPTDTTADGAGITIKGATDKTLNWVQSTGAFTSSEDFTISKTLNPRLKIIDPTSGYTAGIDFITNYGPYTNITSKIFFDFYGTANVQTITGSNGGHGMHYVSGRSNFGNHWFRKSTTDGVQMAILEGGNVGINSTAPTATLHVNNLNSSTIGLIVKAVSSQTANLQEWQNSSGTVLASLTSNGTFAGGGLSVTTQTNTINAGTFYNSAGTPVFNIDTTNNAVNMGGGLSGNPNSFGSTWGYDSSVNAGYISFVTGALGSDSFAIRRTNHIASGDYTLSTLGNLRFSTASGKNFNFNTGNIGIATTTIGNNNKIIVNPYSTVDNLATVQINTNAATNKGLVVQGYASQTANLTEWQNSAGTILAYVTNSGNIQAGTYNGVTIGLNFPGIVLDTSAADNTQVWLRNLSSSTKSGRFVGIKARPFYADAVSGDDLVTLAGQQYISNATYESGKIVITNDNSTPSVTSSPARITFHTTAIGSTTLTERMRIDNAGLVGINMTPTDAYLSVTGSSSKDAIRVYSQGGNLAFWGAGGNNNLYTNGNMYMTGGSWAATTRLAVDTGGASSNGIVIRGVSGQTADLQVWQDYGPTTKASIDTYGNAGFGGTAASSSQGLLVKTNSNPAVKGIVVIGASSQTANLQEWQNDSGNILTRINSLGQFQASSISNSGLIVKSAVDVTATITNASGNGTTVTYTASNTFSAGQRISISGITPSAYNLSYVLVASASSTQFTVTNSATGTYSSGGTATAVQTEAIQQWQDSAGNTVAAFYDNNNSAGSATFFFNDGIKNPSFPWGVPFKTTWFSHETFGGAYYFRASSPNTNPYWIFQSPGMPQFLSLNTNGITSYTETPWKPDSASKKGFIVQGLSSQTGDLQQWQNSAGTALAKIDASGALTITNTSGAASLITVNGAGGGQFSISAYGGISTNAGFQSIGGPSYFGGYGGTGNVVVNVTGASGQTADLQRWTNFAGTTLSKIDASGNFSVNKINFTGGTSTISTSALSDGTLSFESTLGQLFSISNSLTGTIFSINDISGLPSVEVTSLGIIKLNELYGQTVFGSGTPATSALATFVARTGSTIPIVVRQSSSQTASLQEWQNNAGTRISFIGNDGLFRGQMSDVIQIGQLLTQPYSASQVPLVVKGTTSQTANLQEWQDSAGTVELSFNNATTTNKLNFSVSKQWAFYWGTEPILYTSGNPLYLTVSPYTADRVVFATKGKASQTGDLQQWQNSAGTALASIGAGGVFTLYPTTSAQSSLTVKTDQAWAQAVDPNYSNISVLQSQTNANVISGNIGGRISFGQRFWNGSSVLYNTGMIGSIKTSGDGGYDGGLTFHTAYYVSGSGPSLFERMRIDGNGTTTLYPLASAQGLIVKGAASQTASLQEWQNSSGTVLANIDSTGRFLSTRPFRTDDVITAGSQTATLGQISAMSSGAGRIGLVVQGAASQTADLQQWQNNAGTVLTSVDKDGYLQTPRLVITNGGNITDSAGTTPYFGFGSNQIAIYARNAAYKPLIIQGAASQTANLQEWQNNSGTVLAKVDANGNFSAITKSFDIPHPTKENMRLRYASLEGPENGVYIRGTAESNIIELPEYWTELVHEDSITVSLTAFGSAQNIYVEKIEDNKVYIGGELTKAFFTVYGERKDIDKLVVEY